MIMVMIENNKAKSGKATLYTMMMLNFNKNKNRLYFADLRDIILDIDN